MIGEEQKQLIDPEAIEKGATALQVLTNFFVDTFGIPLLAFFAALFIFAKYGVFGRVFSAIFKRNGK